MKLFKYKISFNWKYIIGEIILLFVGINLAIWFNNWNSSKEINRLKQVSIEKIVEEVKNNEKEIETSKQNVTFIRAALLEYEKYYSESSSQIITTPKTFNTLNKKFPGYFLVTDSVAVSNNKYLYNGTTMLNFEWADVSDIAWETTKSLNITNEFSFNCLYQLEDLYSLQHTVQLEIDKAANAIQKENNTDLKNILNFLIQLEKQLLENYNNLVALIEICEN